MTVREVYEAILIELNKEQAPSMLLEDFNYFCNKAIQQYINKQYNVYDVNQQTSDNLRVLSTTAKLTPTYTDFYGQKVAVVELPLDYLHILNCICSFKYTGGKKCYEDQGNEQYSARRLTSDMWSQVNQNYYNRPTYKRPYYFIHNVNTSSTLPTDNYSSDQNYLASTPSEEPLDESSDKPQEVKRGLLTSITIGGEQHSLVVKEATNRYGNSQPIRMEIRCGNNPNFELETVYIDYLKTPQHIKLTQLQLDLVKDTSQLLEYPDYVCYEIVGELVKLFLENASDPRLQTNIPINQTIASPIQQSQTK